MAQAFFSDEFIKPFFLNNFGKKYIYKEKFINNFENFMSLNILNEILSNRSYWNNKNFETRLDKKILNIQNFPQCT